MACTLDWLLQLHEQEELKTVLPLLVRHCMRAIDHIFLCGFRILGSVDTSLRFALLVKERVVFVWTSRGASPFRDWFPEIMGRARKADFVTLSLFDTSDSVETRARDEGDADMSPNKKSKRGVQIQPLLRDSAQQELEASFTPILDDAHPDDPKALSAESGPALAPATEPSDARHRSGRPVLDRILSTEAREQAALLVCGPPGLLLAAQRVARAQRMDLHRETFLW